MQYLPCMDHHPTKNANAMLLSRWYHIRLTVSNQSLQIPCHEPQGHDLRVAKHLCRYSLPHVDGKDPFSGISEQLAFQADQSSGKRPTYQVRIQPQVFGANSLTMGSWSAHTQWQYSPASWSGSPRGCADLYCS